MVNINIFFLPLESRPKEYLMLVNIRGKYWHTGIVYKSKVYECFSGGKYSINEFTKQKEKELNKAKAVWVKAAVDESKILSEINSGTSCGEYVARVVGLSKATGAEKVYYPEEVYNYCTDSGQARMTK